ERAQASRLRCLDEFVDAADVERRVEQRNRFGTDPLQTQQVEDGWWKLQEQVLMKTAGACLGEVADFFRQILADPRQLEQLLFVHSRHGIRPRTYRVRRRAICPNLEEVLSLDFQQVGDLREDLCDWMVIHA